MNCCVQFCPLMHREIISLIKCSNSIHAVGSRRPIQYFAFLDRPGSLCWACVMAYIHVFTWALVPLSIDNFALQLYDLGTEYFSVAPVIPFLFILINIQPIKHFIFLFCNYILKLLYIVFNAFNFCCFGCW